MKDRPPKMELVAVNNSVTAKKRRLKGTWTIEDQQDLVSVFGSSFIEAIDKEFYDHVVETLGHNEFFYVLEEDTHKIVVGDPLFESSKNIEYPIVDGKINV
jgi:hypothetical protein